jgi:integrase/recombinase XerD
MQPTNFSKYLTSFLTKYLSHEKGASSNTIASYRDTFVLLITFLETKHLKISKLTLEQITKDNVLEFLNWVQTERKNTDATRNARLAAIHSFYKYLQYQQPENLYGCQQILSIKMKKSEQVQMNYLSIEGITLLLQQPDVTTSRGRRDLALLSLMYDTGSRVQELIDLTPLSLRLDKPSTIRVTGKGKKTRIIPCWMDRSSF